MILPRLLEIYRSRGYDMTTGLSPVLTGSVNLTFTALYRNGHVLTNHLGIAPQEVALIELLAGELKPRNALIIGNSFGFSSFALALASPESRVIAVDLAGEPFTAEWLEHTNRIAAEEGLNLTAVQGCSPEAVAPTAAMFDAPLDFAFIDGLHTSEQVVKDLAAVLAVADRQAVLLFHDVLAFDMQDALQTAATRNGLLFDVLHATPSGMALAYPPSMRPRLETTIRTFGGDAWNSAVGMGLMKSTGLWSPQNREGLLGLLNGLQ